jgi:major membrane immunogen (membrane-anchored lipoprotein)
MNRFYPIILLIAVFTLSACQISDLQSLLKTEQVITQEPSWTVDGNTYTTTVEYDVPEGAESNSFSLVIKDGIISSIEVGITTTNKASLKYQQDFAKNIASIVVGQKISELKSIDRVSGASVTTTAFNDALLKLQQQLQS